MASKTRCFARKVARSGLGDEEDGSAGDECDTSESESDDDDDDDDSFFQSRSDGDEFDNNEVEEDFVTSDFQCKGSTERVFGESPEALHDADAKFTKVAVLLHNNFGETLQRNSIAKKFLAAVDKGNGNDSEDDEDKGIPEWSVLAKAIVLAKESMHSGKIPMRDGKDEMEECLLSENSRISDENWHRPQGWARRPSREDSTCREARLVGRHLEDVAEMFERGVRKSSRKLGPAQMLEKLEMKHPGLYRLPAEHEIGKKISAHFAKQKEGKGKSPCVKKLLDEIEEKIREFVILHPNEKGAQLERRVSQSYNGSLPDDCIRKDAMDKVN